jgi:DNA polymerase
MPAASSPDRQHIARQVRQQLEALQAAGVEYLPTRPETPSEPSPPPAHLFDAADDVREATDELPPEQRRRELTVLAEQVAACTRCRDLAQKRTQTVFGVGPLDPELCFIGEAPGFDEDRQGEPFVGAAGQLLNRIIAACGLKREEVYICNIIRCRPPGNRPPLADEAANCREYLDRQLELVRPRFICCLGGTAAQNLLETSLGITRLRGSFREYRGIPVMCTYHPSYLLRIPDENVRNARKREVWEDMKKLLQRMGRPIPG